MVCRAWSIRLGDGPPLAAGTSYQTSWYEAYLQAREALRQLVIAGAATAPWNLIISGLTPGDPPHRRRIYVRDLRPVGIPEIRISL
ncbi:MAG: hypothetical protein MUC88_23250 [Planctomycetes bacterium]|jgi:hypothetical protein|nr:hypothetical protein [Planctomycetota bacterium]